MTRTDPARPVRRPLVPKRQRLNPASDATTATATASLDSFLKSALAMADPSVSIGLSLERIHDSNPLQSDKDSLIDGATRVASALMCAARKLAAAHNSSAWPLAADLTIKVFSMLDTESVCCAAATCSLFSKCSSDPLCYANIDLTRSVAKVSDRVVSTMIQRAGNNLQSIKLGRLPQDETLDESSLTGSCLFALLLDGGASGLLLRQLHLYNLEMRAYNLHNFCETLSACRSLVELKIVGLDSGLNSILRIISEYCHSIECLCFDARFISENYILLLEVCDIENLIKNCPLLSSLALRGYKIGDNLLSALIKEDVFYFLFAVFDGAWKALRYVDVSNRQGLLDFSEFNRSHTRCAINVSEFLQEEFLQGRPDLHLIADYPPQLCFHGDYSDARDASSPPPSSGNDAASSSYDEDMS